MNLWALGIWWQRWVCTSINDIILKTERDVWSFQREMQKTDGQTSKHL